MCLLLVYNLIFYAFLQDLIEKAEKQPNLTIGILVAVVVVFVSIFFRLIFGGKKPVSSDFFSLRSFIVFLSWNYYSVLFYLNLITKSLLVQAKVEKKPERTEASNNQGGAENEENKEKEEASNAPRRRPRRED